MTTTPIHSPGPQPSEVNAPPIEAEASPRDERCDEAMISKQRQRYLVSLLSDQEQQSDSQYREQ
jgi:hypothetical protein